MWVVFGISLDVLTKGFKLRLNAGYGSRQLRRQRTQTRQSLAHAADQHIDASQFQLAAAFRTIAQALADALLAAFLKGGKEQMRMIDQTFAGEAAGRPFFTARLSTWSPSRTSTLETSPGRPRIRSAMLRSRSTVT